MVYCQYKWDIAGTQWYLACTQYIDSTQARWYGLLRLDRTCTAY